MASHVRTEDAWRECTDIQLMLSYGTLPWLSLRKLWLFHAACVRRLCWQHLDDPRSRKAVEVLERYVDDLADEDELTAAAAAADAAWSQALDACSALEDKWSREDLNTALDVAILASELIPSIVKFSEVNGLNRYYRKKTVPF